MYRYLTLFIIVFNSFQSVYASKLDDLRNNFPYINSIEEVENYLADLENENSDLATVYKGALFMFKSKYIESKWDKFKFFKKGKNLIETACKNSPNSLEIRYIRLIFQHQLPSFLGYNDHKIDDFNFFINQFPKSSLTLNFKKKMVENLVQLDNLTANQKQKLNNLI